MNTERELETVQCQCVWESGGRGGVRGGVRKGAGSAVLRAVYIL